MNRSSRQLRRSIGLLLTAISLTLTLPAQTPAAEAATGATQNRGDRGDRGGDRKGKGDFNPADMQARMLNGIRTQFAITDDAEWSLIAERITHVMELRRSSAGGVFGGGGGGRPGGGGGRSGGTSADPAQDALRAAITDNLPDAEIKARLGRLRETRKLNEAKLQQAQEELRAVLSVRQEAAAVMAGLLN